jgi:hypothetical protein
MQNIKSRKLQEELSAGGHHESDFRERIRWPMILPQ